LKTILHPAYIPNILNFAAIVQNEICWEVCDNFQKQTFRNRAYICTDRGQLMLNIPIQHVGKDQGRQYYKDVKLENEYKWQRQHWRAIQTAYRTSPYFEFYEDDIAPLYTKRYSHLQDYNMKCTEIICNCLQISMPKSTTTTFEPITITNKDFRLLVDAKRKFDIQQPKYNQVFGERHGFIKNVSVLDLLFNEGPNAISYLKKIKLNSVYV